MSLGLPYDLFTREVLVVVAYASTAVVCAVHWSRGTWARVGVIATAAGALLQAYVLTAWVLYANGVDRVLDFQNAHGLDRVLGWLDVVVLVGVLVALVMERDRRGASKH